MVDLQKASVWKRISALVLDGILLSILIVGFAFLLSLAIGYDAHSARLARYYSDYETEYGITFSISQEEFASLDEAAQQRYEAAYAALAEDAGAAQTFAEVMRLTILIITFGVLLGMLALEFFVPLLFKNGQTLGKKVFGLAVVRRDCVRLAPLLLLVRTLLDKYTMETMIPILLLFLIFFGGLGFVGLAVLAALLVLQVGLVAGTRNNSAIHDLLAQTVVVDMASQMIFDSEQELLAYREQMQAERAARDPYG